MLEKYIPKRFATAMIKHVIAVTLFFPYYTAPNGNQFYQEFILANFFAILAMVFICTSWKLDFKRNGIFVAGLGILLLAYNGFATYMNVKYHHWYGEQINTTISFLFFIVLLLVKDSHALIDTATIKATIHMIVASNVLAIIFRFVTGYNRLLFMSDSVYLITYSEDIQNQFAWLYGHKSEYGLMLVLCSAFFVVYRKQFRNIFTYALSIGTLFLALYVSDSYTAIGASLLIFVGQFLDYLATAKWWKKLLVAVATSVPLLWVVKESMQKLKSDRDILSLNGRTNIWKYFIEYIQNHPNGATGEFGSTPYYITIWGEWGSSVNNAHNVFMNHMLRFSIPVGGIFLALCIMIVLFSIKRKFAFTTVCIWSALFIPIMMDHSLTSIELSYVLVVAFIIFFRNQKRNSGQSINP